MDNMDNEDIQRMAENLGGSSNMASESLDSLAKTAAKLSGMQVSVDTSKVRKGIAKQTLDWFTDGMDVASAAGIATGSLVKFYKDVGEGSSSFGNLNTVMRGLSGSMNQLGPVGRAAGAALDALGPVASEALKELDLQRAAYHDLSKIGALTGEGLKNLQENWGKSELSLKEFQAAIGKNSQTLAAMSGTTSDGTSKFSTMIGEMLQGSDDRLRNTGMIPDDIANATASYLKLQTNLGQSQKKSADQLRQGATDYSLQLMTLSKYSGKQIDEIESSIESTQADDRWQALQMLSDPKAARDMSDRMNLILTKLGPDAAKGFRDAMAGAPTQEAIKFRNTFGNSALDLTKSNEQMITEISAYTQSQLTNITNQKLLNAEQDQVYGNMAEVNRAANMRAQDYSDATQDTTDAARGLNRQTKNTTDTEKSAEKMRNEYHRQLTKALPIVSDVTRIATQSLEGLETTTIELVKKMAAAAGVDPEKMYAGLKTGIKDVVGGVEKFIDTAATAKPSETFKAHAPTLMKNLMRDFELTKEQAAGIVGNLAHESGGLVAGIQEKNPLGGGRGGLGWAQWTGSRRRDFEAYLQRTGQSATDPNANYGFLKEELQGKQKGAITAVKKTTSSQESMQAFEGQFERAGVKHYESRQKWANTAMALNLDGEQQQTQTQEPQPKPVMVASAGPLEPGMLNVQEQGLGQVVQGAGWEPKKTPEQSKPVEPEQPKPVETKPVPEPEQPNRVEPKPVETKPVPEPEQPKPVEPEQPKPVETKPVEPKPIEPEQPPPEPKVESTPTATDRTPQPTLAPGPIPMSEEKIKMIHDQLQENARSIMGETTAALAEKTPQPPPPGGMIDQLFATPDRTLGTSGLTEQLAALTEQAKPDLTAPKLADQSPQSPPSAAATGLATPATADTQSDPASSVTEMNRILSDIVAKLDNINSTGQRQITATADLGKAVRTP